MVPFSANTPLTHKPPAFFALINFLGSSGMKAEVIQHKTPLPAQTSQALPKPCHEIRGT